MTIPVIAQSNAEKEGAEIHQKYVQAIGGKESIDKIKNVEKEIAVVDARGKSTVYSLEEKPAGKSYQRIKNENGSTIESGYDGERFWNKSEQYSGYPEVTPPSPIVRYTKLANETIDGKEYLVLNEHRKDGLSNSKSYYDPESFLLKRRTWTLTIMGQTVEGYTDFSDYQKVDGVLIPFVEETYNARGGKGSKRLTSIKHNVEVKESLFQLS